jgi:hypothetical protein
MFNPVSWLRTLNRWSSQQESALSKMARGKTADRRVAGYSKSERVDAKFFLLAVAPFLPVIISDQIGWSRGTVWYAWFWLSVVWAILIFGVGLVAYWRSLRRSFRK